jgi:hypothetical protein
VLGVRGNEVVGVCPDRAAQGSPLSDLFLWGEGCSGGVGWAGLGLVESPTPRPSLPSRV